MRRRPAASTLHKTSKSGIPTASIQLIIPGVLIGAGIIGLESGWLRHTDHETKEELQEHPHSNLGIDDFSQYSSLAAAYGLRLCGVKGLHDYVDLTII